MANGDKINNNVDPQHQQERQRQGGSGGGKLRDKLRKEFVGRLLNRNQDTIDKITKKAEKPLMDICDKNLPKDSNTARLLPFYNTIYQTIQYQRDNYLVGEKYANKRQIERPKEKEEEKIAQQHWEDDDDDYYNTNDVQQWIRPSSPKPITRPRNELTYQHRIPFSAMALGHIQIVNIGSWFIPSSTIKQVLMPIVIDLPMGSLYNITLNAAINSIPLGQPIVDIAMKNSLLNFMNDPYWRQLIKNQSSKNATTVIMMGNSSSTSTK